MFVLIRSVSRYWWRRNNYVPPSDTVTQKMSNQTPSEDDDAHLADIPDGAGCTEIWERLSDDRDENLSGE